MSFLFNRPSPRQSVPQDLGPLRQAIIQALMGQSPGGGSPDRLNQMTGGRFGSSGAGAGPAGRTQGVLADLLGLTSGQTPGGDVLGPLNTTFNQRLGDQISALNASSPGRFSTANIYQQGQLRERSLNDYNLLASQVLEHGRDRQLQAIMSLLGPVLGPTFGGPFTQGSSIWENLLGGAQAAGTIANPFGGGGR